MLGTAPGMRSGIASVVQTYAAHGLFQRWDAVYVPTHRDGNAVDKATIASGAWLDLATRIATGHVALLHAHLASNASFWRKALLILPARVMRVPYVLHLHGGAFIEFYERQAGPAKAFIRSMLADAARVIALSDEWREAIARIEPRARIEVIPNPVEVPAWQASLETRPPTVLFLGMLLERKGVADLLRAWPAVLAAVPDARLVLAGSGEIDAARAMANDLGIASSVAIEGWVEGEARERVMRKAWVLALPSHVEALPMAVLESLAAGVPVVASRVGGVPALVEDERHGLLVDARDVPGIARALQRILTDLPLRKAMGRSARDRAVTEFSSELIVPRVEALWREIAPAQEIHTRVTAT